MLPVAAGLRILICLCALHGRLGHLLGTPPRVLWISLRKYAVLEILLEYLVLIVCLDTAYFSSLLCMFLHLFGHWPLPVSVDQTPPRTPAGIRSKTRGKTSLASSTYDNSSNRYRKSVGPLF